MVQMASSSKDLSSWNGFQWRRKMEAFGSNDESVVAPGPGREIEAMWYVHVHVLRGERALPGFILTDPN
jgi:acid phosphatase